MKIFAASTIAAAVASTTIGNLLETAPATAAPVQTSSGRSWAAGDEWVQAVHQDGWIFTHNYGDGLNPDQYAMRRAGTGRDDTEAFVAACWHWSKLSPSARRRAEARDRRLLGIAI